MRTSFCPGTAHCVTSASPSSFRYLHFHLQIEKDSKALATSESMILPGREVRSLIYPHVTSTNQPTLGHICGTDIISTIKSPTPPLAKPGTQASMWESLYPSTKPVALQFLLMWPKHLLNFHFFPSPLPSHMFRLAWSLMWIMQHLVSLLQSCSPFNLFSIPQSNLFLRCKSDFVTPLHKTLMSPITLRKMY